MTDFFLSLVAELPTGPIPLLFQGKRAVACAAVFVNGLEESAQATFYRVDDREAYCFSDHLNEAPWPVPGGEAALGMVVVDLDVLLAERSLVEQVSRGWLWAVTTTAEHDLSHAAAVLGMLGDRAGSLLMVVNPIGENNRVLGRMTVHSTVASEFLGEIVTNAEMRQLVFEFGHGKILTPATFPSTVTPRPLSVSATSNFAVLDKHWGRIADASMSRIPWKLSTLSMIRVAHPEIEIVGDAHAKLTLKTPKGVEVPEDVFVMRQPVGTGPHDRDFIHDVVFGWRP